MLKAAAEVSLRWIYNHLTLTAMIAIVVFLIKTERDRETEIRDQQANLVALGPVNFPAKNELYVPRIGIFNSGKTTAYGVGGKISIQVAPPGTPDPVFDAAGYKSQHLVDIAANAGQFHSQPLTSEVGSDIQRLRIQNEYLTGVANGKLNLWIYGGANYTTEFGDKGWVAYCFLLQPILRDVFTCPGNRNQVRIESKSWLQTLLSVIPKWSHGSH